MRKTAIILLLLSALTAGAQYLEHGSMWYNGALVYTATLHEGGKVIFDSTVEGEELEFMLVPVKGEPGTYTIAQGPNDAMMIEEVGHTVRLIQQEDLNILCFYDAKGTLYKLMSATAEEDYQKLNVENWMTLLRGDYTMTDGTRVSIDWNKANVGGTYVPIEAMTFNGHTTGILSIDGEGTALNGCMEVEFIKGGLCLYPVGFDEYEFPHRLLVDSFTLIESNPNYGCYDYVCNTLLHGSELNDFDKPTLRLMRNFILARRGYVFQSRDLKEYFEKEPWYRPAESNDDVQLSLLERLNIELIKYREATFDDIAH
ncbi:MAG: YARHG domain-containing protein [Muribaculaceae bacterium]|nr:YARHG domain-containing protein [Muribaculaceae bacterium]